MPHIILFYFIVFGTLAVSMILTLLVRHICFSRGILDKPVGGRKIHREATALWGGLATGGAIIFALAAFWPFIGYDGLRLGQIVGFIVAIMILMVGGALDDRYDLKPSVQFLFPLLASVTIVASGSGIMQITNPFAPGAISMVWHRTSILGGWLTVSFPADILTILWLLTVTYAMKLMDGLDELVAGLAVIGAILIASLASTHAFFQPTVALLALSVAAAHLGFLPFNRGGSIFLGEAGSTIAGFSLAVLAIISGSKTATAAVAIGIPLIDIALVVASRIIRGVSPFKGDTSHLHFRLLQAGLSPMGAVRLIWILAIVFGCSALAMQTKGRLFLLGILVAMMISISLISSAISKRKSPV